MREFVKAGEVAALFGLDTRTSEWAIWDRMTEDKSDDDIGDRSRWQGRLAAGIVEGITRDHGISVQKALEPKEQHGIMPPRAWLVAPSGKTSGREAVIVVMQRTQQSMFGWEAPNKIPDKQMMRFKATAIAYGCEDVFVGVLVDGYRSELYHVHVDKEERERIVEKVADMIRMVRDDDEPVMDYDVDRSAIRSGKAQISAEQSGARIEDLVTELLEKKALAKNLENQAKQHKGRIDQIETMLISMIPVDTTIDSGGRVLGTERKGDKVILKIVDKPKDATSLF